MSFEAAERLANAVLYEGYMLYPYRPSAVKNRRRFNFGVLVPPSYSGEPSTMRTECLVVTTPQTSIDVRLRYLQIQPGDWQQATEQQLTAERISPFQPSVPDPGKWGRPVACAGHSAPLCDLTINTHQLEPGLIRLTVIVSNTTPLPNPEQYTRDEVLPYSLVSTHTLLAVRDGEFVSLLDPPDQYREAAAGCHNEGTWPVLAGDPGQRQIMLSSPIILYDYAQVAPESPGDLFDGAEIDEILTLRILTLTDDEKEEVRNGDERARRMLERTETLPAEHLAKLHGALRGLRPVGERK